MNVNCSICNQKCSSSKISVRSGKEMDLYRCEDCDFNFFNLDPSFALSKDKLDESRLKSAGLNIPSVNKDFENGTKQSKPYLNEFIDANDKGTNILEIGCSVGYFLNLLKNNDINPFGIELNKNRAKYVREYLQIPCFDNLKNSSLLSQNCSKLSYKSCICEMGLLPANGLLLSLVLDFPPFW